jgi:hypothetical protein
MIAPNHARTFSRDSRTTAALGGCIHAIRYCLSWNSPVRFSPHFGPENLVNFTDRLERVKNPCLALARTAIQLRDTRGTALPGWDHFFLLLRRPGTWYITFPPAGGSL